MNRRVFIRHMKQSDRAEWLCLRQALWSDHDKIELAAETANIAAHSGKEPFFVAERPDGRLCGMIELFIRDHAEGCRTRNIGYSVI